VGPLLAAAAAAHHAAEHAFGLVHEATSGATSAAAAEHAINLRGDGSRQFALEEINRRLRGLGRLVLWQTSLLGDERDQLIHVTPELEQRADGWGQRWMSRNLLGRGPTLEEVGNMAAFLASDLAGATTGTTVSLDGGMITH
jgi:hypothetical protein